MHCQAQLVLNFLTGYSETKRERILENRQKALKIAEKQAELAIKRKEGEKRLEEERLKKYGCPIQKAEIAFFDTINKMKKERERKFNIEAQLKEIDKY